MSRRKKSKAKRVIPAIEKSTPNAIADNVTFGQGADTAVTSEPLKTASRSNAASFMGSQPNLFSSGEESVGPPTPELKEKFSAQKIPLQTDFSELIDVADCGRKAAGLNPEQEGGTGAGLQLDTQGRLAFRDSQLFVQGMIIMFRGSEAPAGWALCDGNNNTPDLRDRFILGGSWAENGQKSDVPPVSGTATGKTYSATSAVVTPSVSTTLTINNTTLNVNQIPAHNHSGGIKLMNWSDDIEDRMVQFGLAGTSISDPTVLDPKKCAGSSSVTNAKLAITSTVGGTQGHGHTHSISSSQPGHSHTVPIITPYYILAFIMKL